MPESMVKEIIPIIGKRYCFLRNRKILLQSEKENSPFVDKDTYLFFARINKFFFILKLRNKIF